MIATSRNRRALTSRWSRDVVRKRTTQLWDFDNKLILVHTPANVRNTMSYDPDGLRVHLIESTETKKFVYDGQAYLLETNSSNIITAVWTNEPQQYGSIITQRRDSTDSWYIYDSLGNTRTLLDNTEATTDTYNYNAFGDPIEQTGTTENPFQWRGKWGFHKDRETGIVQVRQRPLITNWAIWLATDPAGFPNGMNPYKLYFVVNGQDPSGLKGIQCQCWIHSGGYGSTPLSWEYAEVKEDLSDIKQQCKVACGDTSWWTFLFAGWTGRHAEYYSSFIGTGCSNVAATKELDQLLTTISSRIHDCWAKGKSKNGCYAYRDCAFSNDLSTTRYEVKSTVASLWWTPLWVGVSIGMDFIEQPAAPSDHWITDGGILIVDKTTGGRVYLHATPWGLWLPPSVSVDCESSFIFSQPWEK